MQRRADGVPRRSRVAHRPVSMLLAIVVVVVLFAGGGTGHGGSRPAASHPTSSGVGTSSLKRSCSRHWTS